MNRISKFATVLAVLPVLAVASPVFADSPGQLATGVNVYKVKNVTTSGAYAATASASACDVVQYSTELNNGGFGTLTGVVVKATLPTTSATSSSSTVTATPAEGASFGTTGTVTVNLSSAQTINYVNGSAKLYDSNGNVISNLADTILTSGVNIGTINGSTTEYVNFQAKVSCPSTPTTYTASATATATATASATAVCPPNQGGDKATVSATGSATASANATSNVSQADADQKAHDAALAAATPNAQANAKANADAKAQASVKCSSATVTSVNTPPVAKNLPNTGPGDVAGMFAGVSTLGAAAHAVTRRFRR